MTGRFITFEGGEGAGKSTQVARLARRLQNLGLTVLTTREPGGSPRAEELRSLILAGAAKPFGPVAEAILFSAARDDHLAGVIRPALARGEWVVCDRFADSTRAYQGAAGRVPAEIIAGLERVVVGETRPDLTIILDLAPEVGLGRAAARRGEAGTDRYEGEGLTFHRALRKAFLDIARREPRRCVVIDADRNADQIEDAVWRAASERLGLAPRRLGAAHGA